MNVQAITPSVAASAPSHPDHARWVKERTLAVEVEHARMTGRTARDAELANAENLRRLAIRTLLGERKAKAAPRQVRKADLAASGVTRRPAPVLKPPTKACGHCGKCLSCKRDARVMLISQKAREGNADAVSLMWELTGLLMASQRGSKYTGQTGVVYPFDRLAPAARSRVRNAGFSLVCDRSVAMLGEWRR